MNASSGTDRTQAWHGVNCDFCSEPRSWLKFLLPVGAIGANAGKRARDRRGAPFQTFWGGRTGLHGVCYSPEGGTSVGGPSKKSDVRESCRIGRKPLKLAQGLHKFLRADQRGHFMAPSGMARLGIEFRKAPCKARKAAFWRTAARRKVLIRDSAPCLPECCPIWLHGKEELDATDAPPA
jgi:hypothetical protein